MARSAGQSQTPTYIMIHRLPKPLRIALNRRRLPRRAVDALIADLNPSLRVDSGIDVAIDAGAAWLARAQDESTSHDGGVAKHYSLISGWGSSYPETTGYIVPTVLAYARLRDAPTHVERARRMLDWLVSIQRPDGAFLAGSVGSPHAVPSTFNTGQILIGLASGVEAFGERYLAAMRRAADWLVAAQDADGAWRAHPSPLVRAGAKTFDTHVAWGLFEAARIEPDRGYAAAGMRNVRWALGLQTANGWFEQCSIKNPETPATHTIGYALRGVLEAFAYDGDAALLAAARKTADGLWLAMKLGGFLPGRIDRRWRPAAAWSCLTGQAQNATNFMLLWQHTGEARYLHAAFALNRFVRWTIDVDGEPDVHGAVKGSYPVDGEYDPWLYPNWATKFLVDACMLEAKIRRGSRMPVQA